MNTRLVQWVITGLIFSGFVLALSGCVGVGPIVETEAQKPGEARVKPSRGDTRQKVRSILGDPLIEVQSIGVEVYIQSGRVKDLEMIYVPYPILIRPHPWREGSVYTLVVYDDYDVVKDIATEFWFPGHSIYGEFWIKVGDFTFINVVEGKPGTILGPQISGEELAGITVSGESCSLVLVMGSCPMGQVSLDGNLIVDLSPADVWCGRSGQSQLPKKNRYFNTFIQKTISTGSHCLSIHQDLRGNDYETDFECASGKTIYAELEAQRWVSTDFDHPERALIIRKSTLGKEVDPDSRTGVKKF